MPKTLKYLPVDVYRSPYGDCTNGGISGKVDRVYVACEDGIYDGDKLDPELCFTQEQRGANYGVLIPIVSKPDMVGPMAGGNLASTSDSRIAKTFKIHDRWESAELYDALSR